MAPLAGPSTARPPRPRLTREGAALLTNYALTVTAYPQKAEKEALLASLRAIPGNESFTIQKLNSWLTRHRNPSGDARMAVLLDDETILFPKLTPTHLQQLRVLYKKRTEPSDGIITFWADRIKADKAEVVAWIQYQQEKARENDVPATPESPEIPLQQSADMHSDSASVSPIASEFPRPHLPTPAKSPSISPQTRVPSLPPIAVKVEESRQCLSPVSSLDTPSFFRPRPASHTQPTEFRSVLDGLPPLTRLQLQTTRPPPASGGRDVRKTLATSIRDSLRPETTPIEQPPKTVDEFAERFGSVENMIEAFLKKYDTGQLERLGWDSNLSRVTT